MSAAAQSCEQISVMLEVHTEHYWRLGVVGRYLASNGHPQGKSIVKISSYKTGRLSEGRKL